MDCRVWNFGRVGTLKRLKMPQLKAQSGVNAVVNVEMPDVESTANQRKAEEIDVDGT